MTINARVHSALYIQPRNADYDAVLQFFRSERIMEKSQENGGLIDASINVPLSGSGPMLVIAKWNEARDYERWLANPVRAALLPGLSAIVEREPAAGAMYVVRRELRP
jgi:hypothetical protein